MEAPMPRLQRHPRLRTILISLGAVVAMTVLTGAAPVAPPVKPGAPTLSGFGDVRRAIDTSSAEAQAKFNQGMQQAYAFDDDEAVRAFKAALDADPACVMCAWAISWQLGPNFNNPRGPELGEARRYALMAQKLLTDKHTPLVRDLVNAMAARYADNGKTSADKSAPPAAICGAGLSPKADPLDIAYARQLQMLSDAYPADPDLQTWYAEADMMIAPDAIYDQVSLKNLPRTDALIRRLESSLRTHPRHTGLIHYYTHAAATPADSARAVKVGERLLQLAPDASHLLHMSSHLYVRIGRFADAVRVNRLALDAQKRHEKNLEQQGYKLLTNWNMHNRYFLWVSAQWLQDRPIAMAQAVELAGAAEDRTDDFAQFLRAMPVLTMTQFEQWNEVVDATGDPARLAGMAPNVIAYARALALLNTGRGGDTAAEIKTLEEHLAKANAEGDDGKVGAAFGSMLLAQVRAEKALRAGETQAAKTELLKAVAAEPDLGLREPPMWAASAQRNLGTALLRMGDPRGAEAAFRADLVQLPENQMAANGLRQALLAQKKPKAAR
jgi:hypothetical protein